MTKTIAENNNSNQIDFNKKVSDILSDSRPRSNTQKQEYIGPSKAHKHRKLQKQGSNSSSNGSEKTTLQINLSKASMSLTQAVRDVKKALFEKGIKNANIWISKDTYRRIMSRMNRTESNDPDQECIVKNRDILENNSNGLSSVVKP